MENKQTHPEKEPDSLNEKESVGIDNNKRLYCGILLGLFMKSEIRKNQNKTSNDLFLSAISDGIAYYSVYELIKSNDPFGIYKKKGIKPPPPLSREEFNKRFLPSIIIDGKTIYPEPPKLF